MIIKSKFKDYYDHIAHIYGGGDPKIVYDRNKFPRPLDNGYDLSFISIPMIKGLKRFPDVNSSKFQGTIFSWLVITGKYYLLVSGKEGFKIGWNKFKILNKVDHPELIEYLTRIRRYTENTNFDFYIGCDGCDPLLQLSREVNAPVFTFIGYNTDYKTGEKYLSIDRNIPILSELGIPSIYPPEQIYQDISYFIANTINGSPDIMPEPNPVMTDKERISSHGFDLRQSFRHRK